MTADSDPISVARVAAAIRGGRGRSELYRWLWANYATLVAAWEVAGRRADWVATTNALNQLGVRTRDKKRLKPESVRRTWARVDKDARAMGWTTTFSAGAVSGNKPPGQGSGDASDYASAVVVTPVMTTPPREAEPSPEPEFKFATFPPGSSPEPRSDARETPAVPQRQDADAVIARLLARPGRGTIPMPDIPEPEDE